MHRDMERRVETRDETEAETRHTTQRDETHETERREQTDGRSVAIWLQTAHRPALLAASLAQGFLAPAGTRVSAMGRGRSSDLLERARAATAETPALAKLRDQLQARCSYLGRRRGADAELVALRAESARVAALLAERLHAEHTARGDVLVGRLEQISQLVADSKRDVCAMSGAAAELQELALPRKRLRAAGSSEDSHTELPPGPATPLFCFLGGKGTLGGRQKRNRAANAFSECNQNANANAEGI